MATSMSKSVISVSVTMCNTGFTSANPCQVQVHVCMGQVSMREVRTRVKLVHGGSEDEARWQGVKESKESRGAPDGVRRSAEVLHVFGATCRALEQHSVHAPSI